MKRYFIAYQKTEKNGGWGFGQCTMSTPLKPECQETIRSWTESILDKNKSFEQLVNVNYILMGDSELDVHSKGKA